MKIIIANWKMHLGIRESVAQARGVLRALQGKDVSPHVVVCPSFTALAEVRKILVRSRVELGAQNVGPARVGAFTGEVGLAQLEDAGVKAVIVGHSERRAMGETDAQVNEKVKLLTEAGLNPVVCVGESKVERTAGKAEEAVIAQVKTALRGVTFGRKAACAIAYEPVWAIGSNTPATPVDVVAMHQVIRRTVVEETGIEAERVVVLYGGSVDGKNAYSYLREPEIDGLLVGGASLKLHEFEAILAAATEVMVAQETV